MFKSEIVNHCVDGVQKNFYLTQGDTGTIKSVPKQNGELVDFSLIEKCVFKLAKDNYKQIFTKELVREEGKFSLTITSDESSVIMPDTYIYEFEYIFTDGGVQTSNKGNFTIVEQITE